MIRLSRDPTRRTWQRGDGRHGSDRGSVSSAARPLDVCPNPLNRGRKLRPGKQRTEAIHLREKATWGCVQADMVLHGRDVICAKSGNQSF